MQHLHELLVKQNLGHSTHKDCYTGGISLKFKYSFGSTH